jgi:transcriptional regulator with XRE-family HTH domain
MGRVKRWRVERLPEKLLQIRLTLNLSQNELIRELDLTDKIYQSNVSGYELGEREPPLPILLRYARLAGVYLDVLVDDKLDLPKSLPGKEKSQKIKRQK